MAKKRSKTDNTDALLAMYVSLQTIADLLIEKRIFTQKEFNKKSKQIAKTVSKIIKK